MEDPRPPTIDLHADTLSRMLQGGLPARAFLDGRVEGDPGGEKAGRPEGGETALHVDLAGARRAEVDAVVLAAFVEGPGAAGLARKGGLLAGLEMAALLGEIERDSRDAVRQAFSAEEVLENRARGTLSLVFSLENAGDVAEGSLRVLEVHRRLGARFAGLVWFARNSFGSGVGEGSDPSGLSPLGREAVRSLGRMGVAVDLSHLNPAGFRDALEAATGPVVATHSNARAVCDHPRNLGDDQIREIAARGGVVGLCLFPKFLRDPAAGDASMEDAVNHLEHIAEVGGIGCVASGSDFDGCPRILAGISGLRDLPSIAETLRGRGWTEGEIAGWRGGNAFRVLEMLGD